MKELSERRPNTLRSESATKSLQGKALHKYNPSVTLELIRKDDSSAKENPEFLAPQPRLTKKEEADIKKPAEVKEDAKKTDRKLTSKILISEIHFCRFLYKLLGRISDSRKSGLLS